MATRPAIGTIALSSNRVVERTLAGIMACFPAAHLWDRPLTRRPFMSDE